MLPSIEPFFRDTGNQSTIADKRRAAIVTNVHAQEVAGGAHNSQLSEPDRHQDESYCSYNPVRSGADSPLSRANAAAGWLVSRHRLAFDRGDVAADLGGDARWIAGRQDQLVIDGIAIARDARYSVPAPDRRS